MTFDDLERLTLDLKRQFEDHSHTGLDSRPVENTLANQGSLTVVDASTTSPTVYSATEKAVIDNTRTRVNEIEDALKAIGVLT